MSQFGNEVLSSGVRLVLMTGTCGRFHGQSHPAHPKAFALVFLHGEGEQPPIALVNFVASQRFSGLPFSRFGTRTTQGMAVGIGQTARYHAPLAASHHPPTDEEVLP